MSWDGLNAAQDLEAQLTVDVARNNTLYLAETILDAALQNLGSLELSGLSRDQEAYIVDNIMPRLGRDIMALHKMKRF